MGRKLLLLLLALSFVLAACTSDDDPSETTIPNGTTTTTFDQPAEPLVPDLSGLNLPDVVKDQLLEGFASAQDIRELNFLETPTITVLDAAAFRVRVEEMLQEGMEDLPADEALYKLLGLISPETSLQTVLTTLYGEQVAGFYDGRSGEIVVPMRPGGFSLLQQGTIVHELIHALTDQHFDFESARTEMTDNERYDEAAALRALIEGDASFAELQWMLSLSQRDLGRLMAESMAVDSSALDNAPAFIRASLLFPYLGGTEFVQALHARGGWAAVNEAYRTMPGLPGSTEQIITPEDFGRDLPIPVEPIEVSIPGYRLVTTSVWGELSFRLMFDQVLGENASFRASDGWGGDFYHQWFDGQNAALLLVYMGDTPNDVEEMRTALLDYHGRAVPDGAFTWVAVRGDRLFFILAHDPDVGAMLRTEMGLD